MSNFTKIPSPDRSVILYFKKKKDTRIAGLAPEN
jgi:hypothetical protein